MLEPQDFRDVLAVARERSLKGAASLLGVDPATVGRRLDAIEARFGARIFLRSARGLELTPDGAEVASTAEKLEAVQLSFERDLVSRDPRRTSTLIVTAAEWGVPLLTPILLELGDAHPGIRLRLRIENRSLDLTRREADIALRLGRPAEKALAAKRIGTVAYGLYASLAYLDRHSRPRHERDLARHRFCAFDATYVRAPNVRWQAALAGDSAVAFQTNSMLALIEAVRAGGGLAALPCVLGDRLPDLERALPDSAAFERDLWLVFHRDLRGSRAMRPLVNALVDRLRPVFAQGLRSSGR